MHNESNKTADEEPSNDHELAIVRAVNELARKGKLTAQCYPEVAASVDFSLSGKERRFLEDYVWWRLDDRFTT